jgi:hypothetical protein
MGAGSGEWGGGGVLGFSRGAAAADAARDSLEVAAACGGQCLGSGEREVRAGRGGRKRGECVQAEAGGGQGDWRLALGLMRTADLEP